jgi:subtilisin family serine protease
MASRIRRAAPLPLVLCILLLAPTAPSSAQVSRGPSRLLPTRSERSTAIATTKLPWRSDAGAFVSGELVVRYAPGAAGTAVASLNERVGTQTLARMPHSRTRVVRTATDRSAEAVARRLRRSPLVVSVEPNRIADPVGIPDDPYFDLQWYLRNVGQAHPVSIDPTKVQSGHAGTDIDATAAWDVQAGSPDTVIAVIDTGVDLDHPDLASAIVDPWDFIDGDADPSPPGPGLDNIRSHGSHVAGIIGARQDDGTGISGVCPACSVMPLRIDLSLGQELQAIDYAIAHGAQIINMSFGSPVWSKAERRAIAAAGKQGVLVVAAAGNSSSDNDIAFYPSPDAAAPLFPASYSAKTIVSVAAANDASEYAYVSRCGLAKWRCAFTSWGHDSVDVAAPGVDMLSTVIQGTGPGGTISTDYDVWDGTSMAAPVVAGIAGLVLSAHPTYGPAELKNAIMNSAEHPNMPLVSAWQKITGKGRFPITGHFTRTHGWANAAAAIDGSTVNATPKTDGNIDGAKAFGGGIVHGKVTWPDDVNDVYRVKLKEGKHYRILLKGPYAVDLDLWVWNPGTTEIYQLTSGCFRKNGACPALRALSTRAGGSNEQVSFVAKKGGTYFVQVVGWYDGGAYRLQVKQK